MKQGDKVRGGVQQSAATIEYYDQESGDDVSLNLLGRRMACHISIQLSDVAAQRNDTS